MVHAGRDDDQVAGADFDAYPSVAAVANVEDALAVDDESHFVEGVEMLLVELRADGVEVRSFRRERDLILIDIAPIAFDLFERGLAAGQRQAPVENPEFAQIVSGVRTARLGEEVRPHPPPP